MAISLLPAPPSGQDRGPLRTIDDTTFVPLGDQEDARLVMTRNADGSPSIVTLGPEGEIFGSYVRPDAVGEGRN